MTHSLKDSLLIGTALLTILGCGFGLGRLSPVATPPVAPTVPAETISDEVLISLRNSLHLTTGQEKEIAPNPLTEQRSADENPPRRDTGYLRLRSRKALLQPGQRLPSPARAAHDPG